MARTSRTDSQYFGADRPYNRAIERDGRGISDLPPEADVGSGSIPSGLGAYAQGAAQSAPYPAAQLGDGGGLDPRIDPAAGETTSDTLYGWLRSQGIPEPQAGDMTLNQIQQLIMERAPERQDLLDALGAQMSDMGARSIEDPSLGPGAMPRYTPDQ